jgi:LmbE family N-acetylglucosaminyl deacetylase
MVAVRPLGKDYPRRVFAFETLSETNWGAPGVKPRFDPSLFIDIDETLDRKLAAFCLYASQVKPFPHERSVEAISALARLRGATVHLSAAEAFVMVREVG